MTLYDLRAYYNLRQYQISHLLNAIECHKCGKDFEQQMYSFLFYWADAMYEADELWGKIFDSGLYWQARGNA